MNRYILGLSEDERLEMACAEQVMNQYGVVLELGTQSYGTFIPDRLLPYSKDEIKEAIKLCAMPYGRNVGEWHPEFGVGYVSLANFVAEENASFVKQQTDPDNPDRWLGADGDRVVELMQDRSAEMGLLLGEWQRFVSSLEKAK